MLFNNFFYTFYCVFVDNGRNGGKWRIRPFRHFGGSAIFRRFRQFSANPPFSGNPPFRLLFYFLLIIDENMIWFDFSIYGKF